MRKNRTPAERLRGELQRFLARAACGRLRLHLPRPPGDGVARGDGHFHLAPELFLQVSGWTQFRFPHGEQRLAAGEALLLPPRLRHAESVGPSPQGEAFCNLVALADGSALSCHVAHEVQPGMPGILHLESSRSPQAARIHGWLDDACHAAADGSPWAERQCAALVAAATAALLQALDASGPATAAEPVLVAQARVHIQNALGDAQLGVRRLAAQAGCSADYLSHLFVRSTGEHLAAYIVRQRMERAQRLLADSRMAVKEVAWACGYASPSYFVRSFRTHRGLTPQAWRMRRTAAGA